MSRHAQAFLPLCLLALGLAAPCRSETLAEAIAEAYRTNPTIQTQRAQLRYIDENYIQARAGWRPTVSSTVQGVYSKQPQSTLFSGIAQVESNSGTAAVTVTQPVYTGGRTAAAVTAARSDILAAREQLRATEASVIQTVVQAYLDVLRDQMVERIRRDGVSVFASQLEEATARRTAGDATRTDVAEAQTQLENTRGLLNSATAQLGASRAEYFAAVGHMPDQLTPPAPLPGLPATVDEAFDLSATLSPSLLQAQLTEQASRARVAEARAGRRPTVSLQAAFGYTGTLAPFQGSGYDRAVSGEVVINQPIFSGGLVASQVRQALAQNTIDRVGIDGAKRSIVQAVAQDWSAMLAARANILTSQSQVASAQVAVEGDRAEYREGLRSTIDVLIAEEDLETAELNLAVANHDAYLAQAATLAVVGRLEVGQILSNVGLYDPARSLRRNLSVGAVPWEGLISALDTAAAPPEARGELPRTPLPSGPVSLEDDAAAPK